MTQELTGWRTWRLFLSPEEGAVLLSSTRDEPWLAPVLRARKVPRPDSSDGIHALHTEEAVGAYAYFRTDHVVYGRVSISGVVCEHDLGVRGEVARIDVLYLKTFGAHDILPPSNFEGICHGRGKGPQLADLSVNAICCRCGNGPVDETVISAALIDLERRYQCDVFRVGATQRNGARCDTWRQYGASPQREAADSPCPRCRPSAGIQAALFPSTGAFR